MNHPRGQELCLTLGKEYPHASPTGLGFLREWVQSTPGREELGSGFLLCDQEKLGSMMNHCCSFWRSILFFSESWHKSSENTTFPQF